MPKTVVVVPTIRESCIREFLHAWEGEFASAHVIVLEDNPKRTFDLGSFPQVEHLCWEDVDDDLGDLAWIVPRRTDCVRSYGYWRAWREKPEMIVTLDDDCFPVARGGEGFLERHWRRLEEGGTHEAWQETGHGVRTRGYPYFHSARRWRCVLNHGMWQRVPDYDAPTQLVLSRSPHAFRFESQTIAPGKYFPMCGMNLAFRPEIVPALYFLLMGRDFEYDRFGDIWAGVFAKRICDHLGWAINSGEPAVDHRRASNVWANLRKEAPGLELNESLWALVDAVRLTETTVTGCYRQLADALPQLGQAPEYLRKLADAMRHWSDLFDDGEDESTRRFVALAAEGF